MADQNAPRRLVEQKQTAALWGFDKAGRFPPQFVGAVAASLRDSWLEETERIRQLAERWFSEFDDEPEVKDRWRFEVVYLEIPVPEPEHAFDEKVAKRGGSPPRDLQEIAPEFFRDEERDA